MFSLVRDTAVTSYWRNGNKKIETTYKIKYYKTTSGNKVATLGKLKKVHYFDQSEGKEISKDEYYFAYSFANRIDSIENKFSRNKNTASVHFNYITMYFGDKSLGTLLPIKIPIKSSTNKIYKEKDTLIRGNTYSTQIFLWDTITSKHILIGSLRTADFKVYYFDADKGTEELIVDFTVLGKEIVQKLTNGTSILVSSSSEISSALKKELGDAATKTLGQGLINLFLILGKP